MTGHAGKGGQAPNQAKQVGQVGTGTPRNRSNERHANEAVSILESHLELPAPAWLISPNRAVFDTHSVFVAAALPGAGGFAEVDRDAGVGGDVEVACHLGALVRLRRREAGSTPRVATRAACSVVESCTGRWRSFT